MEISRDAFFVEDWLVEPDCFRLTRSGHPEVLEPKVMEVLVCLAMHPGKVIPRGHLLNLVWHDTVVTDHVLNRTIYELRKVFDDDPRHPHFIETIPKAGYRLIAPVRGKGPEPDGWEIPASDDAASQPLMRLEGQVNPSWQPPSLPARTRLKRLRLWHGIVLLALLLLFTGLVALQLFHSPLANPSSQLVPLTSRAGMERDPTFSPDGNYVAYVQHDEEADNFDLYVQLVGSVEGLQLTQTPQQERATPPGRPMADTSRLFGRIVVVAGFF